MLYSDYRDDQVCPSCGGELIHNEDNEGETFQCVDMGCLQLYELDEIIEDT